jgi:hypothetical protein
LHGTAQVLTFKQTKVMDSETASALDGFAFRRNLLGRLTKVGKNAKYVCNIKLAVHIPGREEYVAVVKPLLGLEQRAAVQPGATVSVHVDPDGDPKNIRLDIDPPTA